MNLISNQSILIIIGLLLMFFNSFIFPFIFDKKRHIRDFFITSFSFLFSFTLYQLIIISKIETLSVYVLGRISEGINFAFIVTKRSYSILYILSILYPLSIIYTTKYMEILNNKRQSVFLSCFSFAILCTFGISISENLLTLFLFYEMLTISTYPLVSYYRNKEVSINSKIYIYTLLSTSLIFFLSAIILLYQTTGNLSFSENGIVQNQLLSKRFINILMAMFIFGCAKLPMIPFYFWLPSAMTAPTPVSALLHGAAVVKSGAFAILSILYFIFGSDNLSENLYNYFGYNWLSIVASVTIIIASINAIINDVIKKKLAYSTIANMSYIALAASLFGEKSLKIASFYMISHAFAKMNLFLISGMVKIKTNTDRLSETSSILNDMPITCFNLIISIFSLLGMPFTIGFWAKKNIIIELSNSSKIGLIVVFLFGIISGIIYSYSIIYNIVIKNYKKDSFKFDNIDIFLLIPTTIISLIIITSFIFYEKIISFLCWL